MPGGIPSRVRRSWASKNMHHRARRPQPTSPAECSGPSGSSAPRDEVQLPLPFGGRGRSKTVVWGVCGPAPSGRWAHGGGGRTAAMPATDPSSQCATGKRAAQNLSLFKNGASFRCIDSTGTGRGGSSHAAPGTVGAERCVTRHTAGMRQRKGVVGLTVRHRSSGPGMRAELPSVLAMAAAPQYVLLHGT